MSQLSTHTFKVTLLDSLKFKRVIHFETEIVDVSTDEEELNRKLIPLMLQFGITVISVEQMIQ